MGRRGAPEGGPTDGTRLRRLAITCWTGGAGVPASRLLAAGALVWLVYAGLWLVLDGPVLDESAVAAPIVAGEPMYPPGHPNGLVYRHAPVLLYQLAGLEWRIGPDPWRISAGRNVLFLFLSAFVPFAATVALTRRPSWGHVAAALAVSETGCSMIGVYLLWIFPGVYSTGHVGIHVAVLAVVLLAARVEALGGFVAGLLPIVHGPMTLVAWPALAGVLARRPPRRWRDVTIGGAAGLAVAAAVALGIAWRTAGDVPVPPYVPAGDGRIALRTYMETTDPHRQPFPVRSPIGLVAPIALAGLAAMVLSGRGPAGGVRAARMVVALGAVAFAIVFATRAVETASGTLPVPVLALMPGRYANVAMLLVIPLAVTAIATVAPARAPVLAIALLAVEAVLAIVARPLAFSMLVYAVLGVAIGAALGGRTHRRLGLLTGLGVVAAVVAVGGPDVLPRLAWLVGATFVAAMLTSGAAAPALGPTRLLAAACAVAALAALHGPHVPNEWDAGSERASADERGLADWLGANVTPGAMLVAPLFPPTWLQPKTGHPVLADTMTLANMPYFPASAGVAARIVRDLFGIDYADPAVVRRLRGPDGMLRPTSPVWLAAWEARDCEGWRALADRYGFRHVWSERAHPVRLPVAWSGTRWALHRVPDACPGGPP